MKNGGAKMIESWKVDSNELMKKNERYRERIKR